MQIREEGADKRGGASGSVQGFSDSREFCLRSPSRSPAQWGGVVQSNPFSDWTLSVRRCHREHALSRPIFWGTTVVEALDWGRQQLSIFWVLKRECELLQAEMWWGAECKVCVECERLNVRLNFEIWFRVPPQIVFVLQHLANIIDDPAANDTIRTKCWVEVVRGKNKGRIYGTGQLAGGSSGIKPQSTASTSSAEKVTFLKQRLQETDEKLKATDQRLQENDQAYAELKGQFQSLQNILLTLLPPDQQVLRQAVCTELAGLLVLNWQVCLC
ncbi:hypothetical protein DEO72_LG9g1471 [Vigna unguiculata]|uniref:Uncharacterized protein n=1 Tax=Vigna unguiculata TaxID=3917 RepID=A0A4D6N1W4_VIGUN|nr:hypothetical protein DEO72_LG9g1471 [Vigna unguiculata]